MVTQNTNPFVLPGFGQSGDMASNPMLASMEMMRKAWEGLAGSSGFDVSQAVPGTSPEDLERRIADLRAVENWLRMNLSMLGSTIQTLEVQRSTLATLQAFVASAGGASNLGDTQPSPLDVALGIRRGADVAPSADTSGLFGGKPAASSAPSGQAAASGAAPAPGASATQTSTPEQSGAAPSGAQDSPAQAGAGMADSVMKSWWDMLQTQFDNLASATSATLQGAEAMQEAATAAQQQAVETTRAAADTLKKSSTAASGAAKKAPAKKTAAKKSAAKKTASRKTAAKKAVKKTAARKSASKTASAATTASTSRAAVKKAAAKKAPAKKAAVKTSSDTTGGKTS